MGMIPYFDKEERVERLARIIKEWIGTPFYHHFGKKKVGADCIHFVVRVLEEEGYLEGRKIYIPPYPIDWHLHRNEEKLLQGILSQVPCEIVSFNRARAGDLWILQFGRVSSHASIAYKSHIYHSVHDVGVMRTQKRDSMITRKTHAVRLMEWAQQDK